MRQGTKPRLPERTIASYGHHGHSVRVFLEPSRDLVRVQWREHGQRRKKSWPNTGEGVREAKAWAKTFAAHRHIPQTETSNLTLREMWDRYTTAEFTHLRPRTRANYAQRWAEWERFVGRHFIADDVTLEMFDGFRRARARLGLAVNQTSEAIKVVKLVYGWAQRRELISRNRAALYRFKFAKEDRPQPVQEYHPADFSKLLGQLDPRSSREWRAWVALAICGTQGGRISAVLHLRWDDVDFEAGTIIWRAAWDKMGHERGQPLTAVARDALYVALGWAQLDPAQLGWVFFTPTKNKRERGDMTYHISSFWRMLCNAEKAAGIPHIKQRAAHGLRRMAAGNALDITKNPIEAMHWIGDQDLTQAKRYLKERAGRMQEIANGMTVSHETAPKRPCGKIKLAASKPSDAASLSKQTTYVTRSPEAPVRIELTNRRFAVSRLTTWPRCRVLRNTTDPQFNRPGEP